MNKTITLTVSFATVKEAEEAQDQARQIMESTYNTPQRQLWEDVYTKLHSVYEDMWEATHHDRL